MAIQSFAASKVSGIEGRSSSSNSLSLAEEFLCTGLTGFCRGSADSSGNSLVWCDWGRDMEAYFPMVHTVGE